MRILLPLSHDPEPEDNRLFAHGTNSIGHEPEGDREMWRHVTNAILLTIATICLTGLILASVAGAYKTAPVETRRSAHEL